MTGALAAPAGDLPTLAEVVRVLTLRAGHNAAVVVLGTALLGVAAGLVGVFALLRKRALMGDALSHATLPGIAGAFLASVALGGAGKELPVLLAGAAITGVLGVLAVQAIVRWTRLPEDAAIGAVLSVFFGVGVVLLSVVQQVGAGGQGGLATFIYGQTASMSVGDARLLGAVAALALLAALALHKEFALVCFDDSYARSQGWPVGVVDLAMMALVVLVTVVGLQAVGLLLVVAMLIIPPAAARFWTDRLWGVLVVAGVIGGASGWAGSSASALLPRFPAGAVIVLTAGALFAVSMLCAPRRGVIAEGWRTLRLRARVAQEHALRALWEMRELNDAEQAASRESLRRWAGRSRAHDALALAALRARGLVVREKAGLRMTPMGESEARRIARNHRLWEQYLVTFADVAPTHVDWSADLVEHIVSPETVSRLEAALRAKGVDVESLPDHREREQ